MAHSGFHSLREETAASLPVTGDLPDWLRGSLIRNGPGAFSFPDGSAVDHWFDGLAMLYRFTFDPGGRTGGGGDAVHYRNRFLRTDAYEAARTGEFDGGFATGETTLRSRLAGFLTAPYDNANIVAERVGDRYVALTESPRGVGFEPNTLATTGPVDREGDAPSGQLSCAHFKRDPATGALVTLDTEFGRTSRYHVTAWTPSGDRRHVATVPTEKPAYMHSFALTPRYVVVTEFPLRLDPRRFLRPGRQAPFIEQFEWEPDRGTRIAVVDRTTGAVVAEPVTEPLFGFHHVNAFERAGGSEVVFDLETVPDATAIDSLYLENVRAGEMGAIAGRVDRFAVDLGGAVGTDRYGAAEATVSRERLSDEGTALPTASPARWCREHRYVYAMGMDAPVTEWARRVVKLDAETGATRTFGDRGDYFGEPVFVPAPDGDGEDDGVVLTVALDADADRSRLFVLDGETLAERARATLPHAAPFDFHGRYFPELRAAAAE
ncbi:beta-carotene 15,15'-monooxygenase [Halorubrum sp. Atlit-8R]|uniref:carotenoid oxygenase family protein n=1 Tax=unclassified Halorubrum TaxID=2642239 RepID=UPI000EF2176E|nr:MULTISPECIES: carotenoid oxygenase family protein [unclassified Halorubrum]RLM63186.1 beta-carotene 15,15'-monooxygenase [Halorubrum sp. Atlit-9R]RLM82000.1 beta-carotene 15,15'-monooxygenase [Halorubrum sp. Atlit-8R]